MKKTRLRKIGKDTLHKKAWRVFSKWIRTRDPFCVTHLIMGKQIPSENAGHYWHNVLDFDEININGQCVNCNKWNSGRLAEYAEYLIKKYGIEEFEELNKRHYLAMKGEKRTDEDYQKIIEKYTIHEK